MHPLSSSSALLLESEPSLQGRIQKIVLGGANWIESPKTTKRDAEGVEGKSEEGAYPFPADWVFGNVVSSPSGV